MSRTGRLDWERRPDLFRWSSNTCSRCKARFLRYGDLWGKQGSRYANKGYCPECDVIFAEIVIEKRTPKGLERFDDD